MVREAGCWRRGANPKRERERSHVAARALTAGISLATLAARLRRGAFPAVGDRRRCWRSDRGCLGGGSRPVRSAGPLQQIAWQEKRLQPQTAQVSGERSIKVGFALDGDDTVEAASPCGVSEPRTRWWSARWCKGPRVNVVEPECTRGAGRRQVFATVDLSQPLNGAGDQGADRQLSHRAVVQNSRCSTSSCPRKGVVVQPRQRIPRSSASTPPAA